MKQPGAHICMSLRASTWELATPCKPAREMCILELPYAFP